jgi:fumarate reductase flavoprotein subunit
MSLGAATDNMDAYQGHGSVAFPHGTLVTWAVVVNGGFLVNREGRRFGDETEGYSSYGVKVLRQTDRLAFEIFDERIYRSVLVFPDFQACIEAGAVMRADSVESLADQFRVDPAGLAETLNSFNRAASEGGDPWGRTQFAEPLSAPFYGVQVTGALFHTQGGLRVDKRARVLRPDGKPVGNLYAGGGTATGISGSGSAGYIAGNGLLTALGWGKIAGEDAAGA